MVFCSSSPKGLRQVGPLPSPVHLSNYKILFLLCHVLELLVLQELSSLRSQRLRLHIPGPFRVSSHSKISASMAPEPVLSLSSERQLSLTEMEKAQTKRDLELPLDCK